MVSYVKGETQNKGILKQYPEANMYLGPKLMEIVEKASQ